MRNITLTVVADQNTAEARDILAQLKAELPVPQTIVSPELVKNIIPVRASPAIGVIVWSTDLQGVIADVKAFADYVHDEDGVRKASKESQAYIPDAVAWDVPRTLYDIWSAESVAYAVGVIVLYGDDIYRCLQAHTSQASWTPDAAPSLWGKIADPAEEYPAWTQPVGSTDAYALGAKVSHNEKHWTSNVANNVWEPGVYGWDEVTGE